MSRFTFSFDARYRRLGRLFGINPSTAWVEVDDAALTARFGPWNISTARANIVGAEVSGPYAVPKTIGPARLSVADLGLTFATNPDAGLCVRFAEPVAGIDPLGVIRHRGLTVTVTEPTELAEELGFS